MAQQKEDKAAASEKSEEFKAFEDLAKKVLGVPKTEIDRRQQESKQKKTR